MHSAACLNGSVILAARILGVWSSLASSRRKLPWDPAECRLHHHHHYGCAARATQDEVRSFQVAWFRMHSGVGTDRSGPVPAGVDGCRLDWRLGPEWKRRAAQRLSNEQSNKIDTEWNRHAFGAYRCAATTGWNLQDQLILTHCDLSLFLSLSMYRSLALSLSGLTFTRSVYDSADFIYCTLSAIISLITRFRRWSWPVAPRRSLNLLEPWKWKWISWFNVYWLVATSCRLKIYVTLNNKSVHKIDLVQTLSKCYLLIYAVRILLESWTVSMNFGVKNRYAFEIPPTSRANRFFYLMKSIRISIYSHIQYPHYAHKHCSKAKENTTVANNTSVPERRQKLPARQDSPNSQNQHTGGGSCLAWITTSAAVAAGMRPQAYVSTLTIAADA